MDECRGAAAAAARGLAALAVCVAVELSQRYHTPFLDALRRTLPGHLVLGSGYDPRDFLAYSAGVVLAIVLVRALAERDASAPRSSP